MKLIFVVLFLVLLKLSSSSSSESLETKISTIKSSILSYHESGKLTTWVLSIIGALLVGISGILPYLIIPQVAKNHEELLKKPLFKYLVSFAAGSLLGDVFLHLLPETYTPKVLNDQNAIMSTGLYTLFGLLSFFAIEKLFPDNDEENKNDDNSQMIKPLAYLNMLANVFDNFTHGIAVAGSFQTSIWSGLMTLFATLLHEIPHEIGDFAVLLHSGLSYGRAVRAQLSTALVGICGALFALYTSQNANSASSDWILPYTSGGFLYISLVGIIPDLIQEKDIKIAIKMIISLFSGIFIIYFLTLIFD